MGEVFESLRNASGAHLKRKAKSHAGICGRDAAGEKYDEDGDDKCDRDYEEVQPYSLPSDGGIEHEHGAAVLVQLRFESVQKSASLSERVNRSDAIER